MKKWLQMSLFIVAMAILSIALHDMAQYSVFKAYHCDKINMGITTLTATCNNPESPFGLAVVDAVAYQIMPLLIILIGVIFFHD